MTAFWIIFVTLMLPVEVRIYPTYKIVADLQLLDTYAGLTLPLIASATGTLLFRQFFMTVPDELVEASQIDGAGPFRFFKDTLLPLSMHEHRGAVRDPVHLWLEPVSVAAADHHPATTCRPSSSASRRCSSTPDALTEWQLAMATAMLAMLPPVAVVVLMQRLFVRGLVETEK